jgi:uncharacterized protein YbjT (DUF2867 family)
MGPNVVEHDSPILVAGGSGLLAGHVILRLPTDGHRVRTTVRSPSRKASAQPCSAQAWAAAANDVELTVINPVGIFGPVLAKASFARREPPRRLNSSVAGNAYSASWLTSPAKMPGSAAAAGTIADRTDACALARNRPAVSTR